MENADRDFIETCLCGRKVLVPAKLLGRKIRCPCGRTFRGGMVPVALAEEEVIAEVVSEIDVTRSLPPPASTSAVTSSTSENTRPRALDLLHDLPSVDYQAKPKAIVRKSTSRPVRQDVGALSKFDSTMEEGQTESSVSDRVIANLIDSGRILCFVMMTYGSMATIFRESAGPATRALDGILAVMGVVGTIVMFLVPRPRIIKRRINKRKSRLDISFSNPIMIVLAILVLFILVPLLFYGIATQSGLDLTR